MDPGSHHTAREPVFSRAQVRKFTNKLGQADKQRIGKSPPKDVLQGKHRTSSDQHMFSRRTRPYQSEVYYGPEDKKTTPLV
jgi:hypothetical protein